MEQAGNEFLELLNNRSKDRKTCLLAFLKGKVDGEVVTDLAPAEAWCFDADQTWNRCYTARYCADGAGPVVAPLIRQFVSDLGASGTRPIASEMAQSVTDASTGMASPVGVIRKAEGTDWTPLEESLRGVDVGPSVMDRDVIHAFGSQLRSVLHTGQRVVLFCEVVVDEPSEHEPSVATLGLTDSEVGTLLEVLPERCAVVFAGVNEISPYRIHDGIATIPIPLGYVATRPPEDRSQPIRSDAARGQDELNIQSEVNALADAIAAKDMDPPLVLGILGGWGAGKSFVMHLLEERLLAIRRKNLLDPRIQASHPYVGHFYLARFDAWTYAKADLWSSLTQEVLLALNDQIAYEQLSVERDWKRPEDRDLLGMLETALGDKDAFDEEAIASLLTNIRATGRDETGAVPDPPDLTEEYLQLKRKLFEERFGRVLAGEDGFSGDPVEMITSDDTDARRILENLDNDVLWRRLQGLNRRLQDILVVEEEKLSAAKARLAEREARLGEAVDLRLRKEHWRTYASRLVGVLADRFREKVESAQSAAGVDKGIPFEEAIASVGVGRKIAAGWTFRTVVMFVGFVVVGIAASELAGAALAQWLKLSGILGGALGGALEAWGRSNAWLEARVDEFEAFDQELKEKQPTRRQVLMAEARAAPDHRIKEQEVAEREAKVESYRRRIGLTAGHATLLDFIANRLEEGGYVERLGLLHQVQQDIRQLSDGLRSKALCVRDGVIDRKTDLDEILFPRGLPRVVLFIDDLDRCPPGRVVEVLEAAQLLVKTQLFVVVMAMDVRYITKALEKAYEGVLDRRGDPSGLDYIEKIVQIPYRIRPISPDAMPGYLRSQMGFEAAAGVTPPTGEQPGTEGPRSVISAPRERPARIDETIPQRVLAFDEGEMELLQTAALGVTTGPRATKRLVNVMKLIKIIWYRTGADDVPLDVEKAVIFFLALSARHAGVMRWVLLELEKLAANPAAKGYRQKLPAVLGQVVKDWGVVDGRGEEWRFLVEASKNPELLPQDMTLEALGTRNIELIRSFSFVGEVDLPPIPDTHRVAVQLGEPVRIRQAEPVSTGAAKGRTRTP